MRLYVKRGGGKKNIYVPNVLFMLCCIMCLPFFSTLSSSEANLLSIDDSDGPFSPNEDRKVSTCFMVKMGLFKAFKIMLHSHLHSTEN